MVRIQLDVLWARNLGQSFLQATDRKIRDRLRVLRMGHEDVAADLGVSTRTIQNWREAGLDALKPRKAKG